MLAAMTLYLYHRSADGPSSPAPLARPGQLLNAGRRTHSRRLSVL